MAVYDCAELLECFTKFSVGDVYREIFHKNARLLAERLLFGYKHPLKLLAVDLGLVNDGSAFAH